jgi:LuxR family maltose regulon positive regulatory protein
LTCPGVSYLINDKQPAQNFQMSFDTQAAAQSAVSRFATSHKFTPPPPLVNALRRHRLLSDVLANSRYAAVVIQGPAGHGKTTLMQQVLQDLAQEDVSVGWLTLEESDNDISRFSACLTTLVNNALGDLSAARADIPSQDNALGTGMVESILLNLESAGQPIALFLDEFQLIDDPVIINLIDSLLERIPPSITFYIGSRSIPELARGRLMISGRVKWLTPEELCFTEQEVHDFLQKVGLEASQNEAEAFQQRTGGWPAVLQLLQLALKSGRLSRHTLLAWAAGCENELRDYLADNVMSHQSAERRRFLLRTSILRRLTAPLCEALVGTDHAQPVLQELVNQGLFIRTVDVEHNWFKYHSIFSSYLVTQLERGEPEAATGLHAIAANWFGRHGHHEEAIYHATKAGEFDLAADVIADWIPTLIRTARLRTVERVADLLPPALLNTRPILLWGRTWALLFLNQLERARQSLEEFEHCQSEEDTPGVMARSLFVLRCAEALARDQPYCTLPWFEGLAIATDDMPRHRCFEMGALANAKAINSLQAGKFAQAREFALLGESLGARGEAAFSSAYSTSLLAYALILEGRLEQALKRLQAALNEEQLKVQGSFASTSLSAVYGFALCEAGQFARAESLLRDSIDMIAQTLPVDWLISAQLSLARSTLMSQGDDSDHQEILDNAERLGLINRTPRLVHAIRLERIRLALLEGNCQQAANMWDRLDSSGLPDLPEGWGHFSQGCDDEFICNTRLAIQCGDPAAVTGPLDAAAGEARTANYTRREIKLRILQAITYDALNKDDRCRQAIGTALDLAAPGGYLSSFLEEGSHCLVIVEQFAGAMPDPWRGKLADFVLRLLTDAGVQVAGRDGARPATERVETLTKKELGILRLMVSGATNAEMADRVFVSRNTVKFHLKNIYAKLNVSNRVQATSVARNLNLV